MFDGKLVALRTGSDDHHQGADGRVTLGLLHLCAPSAYKLYLCHCIPAAGTGYPLGDEPFSICSWGGAQLGGAVRDARSGAFFSTGLARGRVADGHACADIHPAVLAHSYQHAHWGIGGSCSDRFGRGARSHPDSIRAPLLEPC